jgi:CrcB protein
MEGYLLVGLGSMVGGLLRRFLAGLEEALVDWVDVDATVSTFIINVSGSFAIGVLAGLPVAMAGEQMRLFFGAGMCGGFTALSSFSVETMLMLRAGEHGAALLNAVVSSLAGFAAAALGLVVARLVWGA